MQSDCFPQAEAEWLKGPLSKLASVNPSYPMVKGHEYPFVEMAAVGEEFQGIQRVDRRKMQGSGLSRFKVGDILFAKITPCPENGKIAFVSELPGDVGLGSTEFIVLSPRGETDPRFLYHLVSSHAVRGRAIARMEGSTGRQRVPDEVFTKRLLVPVPEPGEQAAIARRLDAVDIALDRIHAAAAEARRFKLALLQRVLACGVRGEQQRKSSIGFVPNSWDIVPLRSVVQAFQYGLSVSMDQQGELPILRMGNIQAGEVVFDDLKYVSLPEKVVSPYLLHRGDVVFNRTNSQELVGKVGIYRHDVPAVFASYLIRLIPDRARIDPYYLGHVLNSYSAQCRIKRFATPGVQQVNVNATNLGKVLIPLPVGQHGIQEQRQIARLLEAADSKVRSYGPVVSALRAVKASLTDDLLTGRVRLVPPSGGQP